MRLPRVRFTVRGTMLVIAFTAIIVVLVLQQAQFARREAELNKQLVIAQALPRGHEHMRSFLGDMGIVIARSATGAELLKVTGPYQSLPPKPQPTGVHGYYPVSPNGEVLDSTVTRRLADELLNPRNYIYLGAADLPDPEFGVRLWQGKESLDVLFSLDSGHLDVWAFQRDERGGVVHGDQGWVCFGGDALERLVRDSLVR